MKTYYSIVSIATLPQLNEKFNVGLLCITPNHTFFRFSETKFKIVSKLLTDNGSALALSALKGMDHLILEEHEQKHELFGGTSTPLHQTSASYLNYLSRYNNGLVQFSDPKSIDVDMNDETFQLFFKKYIYAKETFERVILAQTQTFGKVRERFKKSAKPYANIDFDVNSTIISDLIVPVKVDAFGKNGCYVVSQSINFDKAPTLVQQDVSSYLYLIDKTMQADRGTKSFILGDEPSKNESVKHQLWKDVNDSKLIEFVSIKDAERIIQYMKDKQVIPVQSEG